MGGAPGGMPPAPARSAAMPPSCGGGAISAPGAPGAMGGMPISGGGMPISGPMPASGGSIGGCGPWAISIDSGNAPIPPMAPGPWPASTGCSIASTGSGVSAAAA